MKKRFFSFIVSLLPILGLYAQSNTIIADCENANSTKLLTNWFSYSDDAGTYITPLTDANTAFTMTTGGANGTANAAMIDYSLDGSTTLGYNPFAGLGFAMNDPESAYDLSGSTGISFYYKSENQVILEINLSTILDDCNYYANLPAATSWTKKTLLWSQFTQNTWGTKVKWNLTQINKFQWKVQDADGTSGQLWVDEVQINGIALTLPNNGTIDKSILLSTISSANTIYQDAIEGTSNGNYPTGTKAILLSAINSATDVNDNSLASQDDVDASVLDLNNAIDEFKSKIVISNGLSTLIFDAETANVTKLLTNWYSYSDAAGTSVIPTTTPTSLFSVTTGGVNGSANAAMINYDLYGFLDLGHEPFAGMGFAMMNPESAYDFSGSTGISFYYKSDNPLVLEVNLSTIVDDCNFYASLPVALNWTKKTLTWNDFIQNDWGIQVDWDLTKIKKFQWKVQNVDETTGQLWIDEVKIEGKTLTLPVAPTINKAALVTAISSANTTYNEAIEGVANGNYPVGSKVTLLSAIKEASTLQANPLATQSQVDASVITLTNALNTFKNSKIVVSKTGLITAISTANTLYSNSKEGLANGNYQSGSKAILLSAINSATSINTNINVSQAQVDAEITALNNAVIAFQNAIIVVSKTGLIAAISTANTLYSNSKEGLANGNYPSGSKAILLSAINSATSINTNVNVSQAQVDAEITALNNTVTAFQNSIIVVSKTELITAISTANTLYSNSKEGLVNGNYPSGSKAILLSAINVATSISNDVSVSQTQVDESLKSLLDEVKKFQSLVIEVDKSKLLLAISNANALYEDATEGSLVGEYEVGSKAKFFSIIESASSLQKDVNATQEQVNVQLEGLNEAIKLFDASEIKTDINELSKFSLSVYPNPCVDYLQIKSDKVVESVKIVDLLGVIQSECIVLDYTAQLNVSNIISSVYNLQITFVDGTFKSIQIIK